jgi:hypothetical protein
MYIVACKLMLMSFLDEQLNHILKKIKADLIIGSANKEADLEHTSSWSGDAVDHTRSIATYEKSKNGYSANFFKLRVCSEKDNLDYVTDGANGKYSRAGNCQEHVGLDLYYLSHYPELWSAIDVLTLDDCFDHVFLRITGIDKKIYYFDSWSELIFEKPIAKSLYKMAHLIINGFKSMKDASDSVDEVNEYQSLITQCELELKKGAPLISTESSYTPQDSKRFIEQFDSYYNSLLKSSFPRSIIP